MSMGGIWCWMQNSTRLTPVGKTNASDALLVQFQTFFKYKPVSLLRISHFIGQPFTGTDSAMDALFKTAKRRCKAKKHRERQPTKTASNFPRVHNFLKNCAA